MTLFQALLMLAGIGMTLETLVDLVSQVNLKVPLPAHQTMAAYVFVQVASFGDQTSP